MGLVPCLEDVGLNPVHDSPLLDDEVRHLLVNLSKFLDLVCNFRNLLVSLGYLRGQRRVAIQPHQQILIQILLRYFRLFFFTEEFL